jgi:hypothetical protein
LHDVGCWEAAGGGYQADEDIRHLATCLYFRESWSKGISIKESIDEMNANVEAGMHKALQAIGFRIGELLFAPEVYIKALAGYLCGWWRRKGEGD